MPDPREAKRVIRQPFDEAIFGVPYFRIPNPDAEGLTSAFETALAPHSTAKADARPAVEARATLSRLEGLGFHRVCTQVTFHAAAAMTPPDPAIVEADRWTLSPDDLDAHARGFVFSRFAQDVKTAPQLAQRWIRTWLANSVSGRRRVLALGPDVVTWAPPDKQGVLTIDLVSVLRAGQGHGSRLILHLRGLAGRLGASRVQVTTEAENVAAQRLYTRCGFELDHARACLHYTHKRAHHPTSPSSTTD